MGYKGPVYEMHWFCTRHHTFAKTRAGRILHSQGFGPAGRCRWTKKQMRIR